MSIQARNQKFFRAGEFLWNEDTLIHNHVQHEKEWPRREKWLVSDEFLKSWTGILSLPEDFWFSILVSAFAISSVVTIWDSGFCFSILVTYSLWEWFLKSFYIILCTSCGLVTILPSSLYMVGFSKGFWCSFLTALNILRSSFYSVKFM